MKEPLRASWIIFACTLAVVITPAQAKEPEYDARCREDKEHLTPCPMANEYMFLADALSLYVKYVAADTAACPGREWDHQAEECTSMGARQYVNDTCGEARYCDVYVDYDDNNLTEVLDIYRITYVCCQPVVVPAPTGPPPPSLTLEAPRFVRYEPAGSPVNITVLFWELEKNVAADECAISFGDGEEGECSFVTSEPLLRLAHVYQAAGCYQLRVQVTSLEAEAQQEICVLQSLEGAGLSMGVIVEGNEGAGVLSDPLDWLFFTGQSLVFNASLAGSTVAVEYHWDFGGNRSVTASPTIRWSFAEAGEHTVVVAALNRISNSDEMAAVLSILDPENLPCNPSRVQIDGRRTNASTPLAFPRHVPLSFRASTDLVACPLAYCVDLRWTLLRAGPDGEAEAAVALPSSVASHLEDITMPKGLLGYGLYALEFHAAVSARSGHGYVIGRRSDRAWLRIKPSPPVAIIKGGSARSVGYSSSLVLDGSGSHNPDDFLDPAGGLQYEWHCAKGSGDYQEWIAAGACFEGGHRLPFNGSSVRLLANTLAPDQIYEFTLTVSLAGQGNASTAQRITVVAQDPPILSISCLQNCEEKLSIGDRVVVGVTSPTTSVTYAWDVLSSDNRPLEGFDWDAQTTTGRFSSYLVIVGGAFDDGDYSRRSVRVTGAQPDGPPGFAVFTFELNAPPHLGTCSLSPPTGYALQTRFVVDCVDFWDEEGRLMYTVRVPPLTEGGDEARLQYLAPLLYSGASSTTPSVYLPLGDQAKGHLVTIAVDAADIHGATVQFTMTAVVLPPETINVEDDQDTNEALLNLTSGTDSELQALINKGDYQTVVQIIGAVGSILDSHDASGEAEGHTESLASKAIRKEIRSSAVDTIANMPIESVVSLQQSSYALVAITQDKTEITQATQLTAATTLVKMGAFLKEQSVERTACDNCQRSIDDAALNLVTALSNVLDAAVASVEELTADETAPAAAANDTAEHGGPEDVDTAIKDDVKEKSKEVAKAAFAAIADVQDALIVNKVPGEAPTVIRSPVLTLTSRRQAPGSLGREPIGMTPAKRSGFILPNIAAIDGFLPANYTDAIDTQMVQFATDPFVWSKGSEDVTSEVVGLQLKTVDRQKIKVANLPEDIQIFIPKRSVTLANNTEVNMTRGTTVVVSFRVTNTNATVSVLALPADGATCRLACCLRFQGNDSSGNATTDDCHVNATLPGQETKYQLPLDDEDRVLKQRFTWMIDRQFGQGEGLYQVLCRAHDPPGAGKGGGPAPDESGGKVLVIAVYSSQCLFWNDADDQWDRTGCRVGPLTSPEVTQCLCNHLTFFGSSFLVMPNKIDFLADSRLFLTFVDNPVVVTAVGAILILYAAAAVWARRRDRADILKACVITLEDNDPFAHHRYDVTVVTGMRRGAGTTATATLTVAGTLGRSRSHVLQDRRRQVLQRGGVDSFLVTTKQSLGEVTGVRIWHDNGGGSPEWYASRITVHDLETDEWWFILCNAWLGVDMGEGLVDRTFPAATAEELRDFRHLFSTRTIKDMQDGHLWFSIFHRPARSTFTRLQRVSCCLSLLMSVMLTSIMFYGVPADPAEQVVDFGTFRITFSEILIGIESSVLAFPVNLLIVTIFRYARPAKGASGPVDTRKELGSGSSSGSYNSLSSCRADNVELSFFETPTEEFGFSTDSTYYTTLEAELSSSELALSNAGTSSGCATDGGTLIESPTCKSGQLNYNAFLFSCLDKIVDDLDLMSPGSFSSPQEYLRAKREARALVLTVMTVRTPSSSPSDRSRSDGITSGESSSRCSRPCLPDGLPHWFIYVGWLLVFSTTLVSSYFTMLYGLKYGKKRSVDWLISLGVSLFQSIFLIQPLKVLLFAAFAALVLKQWDPDDDGSDDIEERKVDNAQAVYHKLLRKWKGAHYRPPTASAVGASRHRKAMERKMYTLLRQILGYVFFIWLVLIISYSQRDRYSYYLTKHVRDVFFSNDEYDSISEFGGFFEWADVILIPGLYEGAATTDTTSFLIGGVRLRQLRVRPDSCDIPPVTGITLDCSAPYSPVTEDTAPYTRFWAAPLAEDARANGTGARPVSSWEFRVNVASGLWGRVTSYGGGGYVANLGPTRTGAARLLAELRADRWLDHRTRALVVEWTVYNANTNLFSVVSFLVECPATGGFVSTPAVRMVRLHRGAANLQAFVLCIEILFALYTVFYAVVEARKAWTEGYGYWRGGWNWLEAAIVLTCSAAIAVYIYRHVLADRLLASFRDRPGAFVDLHAPAAVAEALDQLLGLLLVLCTVKFLRLLRLNPRTYLLTSVLSYAAGDAVVLAGYIGLIMCAFALLFQLVFGSHVAAYSTVALAFESLFALFLGEYDFEELYAVSGAMAPCLVFIFQALATLILLNVLIAVLNSSMSYVRRHQEPSEEGRIGLLLINKILSWLGIKHKYNI